MLGYSDITEDQQALISALYRGHCLAVCPMGYGKSVCSQTAIQELLDEGYLKRCLIVAPLKVAQLTWAKEHEKWEHLWPVALAIGSANERKAVISSGAKIVVINLENFVWLFNEYPDGAGFDGLLVDELSKLKSAGSKTVKKIRHKLKKFSWRAGLTGTPVSESGLDIYSQALVVDGGKALGTRQDRFRQLYAMQVDFKGYRWALQPGAAPRIAEALKDILFIADSASYEDSLPPLKDTTLPVRMPDRAWDAYADMAEELMADIEGTEIEALNAGVMTGKLQQIVQGFVYSGEGPARLAHGIHSAKLDALEGVLADGRPTVVAYRFQWELEQLKLRYPGLVVLGESPIEAERAWNAGELKVLAVHPQSGSHGVNLQSCPGGNRLVCLSPDWSADRWKQLVSRIRRRGQAADHVERIVLVTSGTVDDVVMDRLAGKAAAEYDLMQHLKTVSG